ncbi:hypothetical protein [Desulfocurvibacter africanus]|uniref:hypothetical protein n=1 Tax=Desulfocurvibacter africanus TaxID=873 RepID=UPI0004035AE5|nr:hypothetical protein [Desulfocurvibacter africanus]
MRIRFALLLVLVMVAVSACGPKYVGQIVKVRGIEFAPMSLTVGQAGYAKIYLEHFNFKYNITRTGENTYSMTGHAAPLGAWSPRNGNFCLLLLKNGEVVGERTSYFGAWVPGGYKIAADFESPEFDHITTVYSLKVIKD